MGFNQYIAEQFSRPVGLGGRIVAAIMNWQNKAMYEATEKLLAPKAGDVLLDIGCGNGYMLDRLSRYAGVALWGTDISEDMLDASRRRLKGEQLSLACCSVDEMPLEDSSIDKACTINTVYFWDDLEKAFGGVYRVIKPGGVFVNTFYTGEALGRYPHTRYGYQKYSLSELSDAAIEAGFSAEMHPIMDDAARCMVCRKGGARRADTPLWL